MSNEDKGNAGLVRSQSVALSSAGATSLVRRAMQDLRVREDADEWYLKGLDLRDEEMYEEAFECFQRGSALNPNHAGLLYSLGVAYWNGEGVPQDHDEAATWWRRAADRDSAVAREALGGFSEVVLHDYSLAAAWYCAAAEQGNSSAAFKLAALYQFGQGVQQDYAHAATYYCQAAEGGDERAQPALYDMLGSLSKQDAAKAYFALAWMHQHGKGVLQDYALAGEWYRKAAEHGHERAQHDFDDMRRERQNIANKGVDDPMHNPD